MEKKNQVLMTVLGVFALVIVTVGVSYAFFTYTRTSTNEPKITTGSLDFGFTETGSQSVALANALPIANATAEATTSTTANVAVYNFTVGYNTTGDITTKYDINIVKQPTAEGTTALEDKFVKVALFEGNTNLGTKTLEQAIVPGAYAKDKAISSGTSTNYTLKMWIDKDVAEFNATDTDGNGELAPGADDNYTSDDKQTATAAWAGKTVSVKVQVTATGTAN